MVIEKWSWGDSLYMTAITLSTVGFPGCPLIGKTVFESELRRKAGVKLVAIYRAATGTNIFPEADTIFEAEDKLIILGSREQLVLLEKLTAPLPLNAYIMC
jgi:Trk K+ transport system NAD-binding subunit